MDCSSGICQPNTRTFTSSIPGCGGTQYQGYFKDAMHCLYYADYNNRGFCASQITNQPVAPINPACCLDPAVYVSGRPPLYCEDPDDFTFSTNTCSLQTDPITGYQITVCPNAGVLDALRGNFVDQRAGPNYLYSVIYDRNSDPLGPGDCTSTDVPTWGFGNSGKNALDFFPNCYDASIAQQTILYKLTHQFCPALGMQFSYSGSVAGSLYSFPGDIYFQFLQPDPGITAECCLRADQTALPSQCHMMACYNSPHCAYILRDKKYVVQNFSLSQDWLSWSNNASFSTNGIGNFPTNGAEVSNVDQAMFSVLDYCKETADAETCDAIEGVGGGTLFPRLDAVHIYDITRQLALPFRPVGGNTQVIQFSVTNMSQFLIKSLSVYNFDSANYTISIANQTLLPFEETSLTLSTTLTTPQSSFTYIRTRTEQVYTDQYNIHDCVINGQYAGLGWTYAPSTITTCSAVDPIYYQFPNCFQGDATLSFFSETSGCVKSYDAGPANAPQGAGFPSGSKCDLEDFEHAWDYHATFPGCPPRCAVNGQNTGCGGQYYDDACDKREGMYVNLLVGTSCSSIGYKNLPFYFYDSMKTNLTDPLDQSFIVLGGFAASMEYNLLDMSLKTFHLVVLPLTNNPTKPFP